MRRGFYAVFEGTDGSGKTSTMHAVAKKLTETMGEVCDIPQETHHPGSTPLGRYLRKLVKFPESIDPEIIVDDLSRQMLYMVDTVSFVKTMLEPALAAGQVVLADRSSFISAAVYGLSDGLAVKDIERLFALITPPRADRLYVLSCPWDVGKARVESERSQIGSDGAGKLDHYDRKPQEYYQKIASMYDNLITSSPEVTALVSRSVAVDDVIYIDATLPPGQVVDIIVRDLVRTIKERCVSPFAE